MLFTVLNVSHAEKHEGTEPLVCDHGKKAQSSAPSAAFLSLTQKPVNAFSRFHCLRQRQTLGRLCYVLSEQRVLPVGPTRWVEYSLNPT